MGISWYCHNTTQIFKTKVMVDIPDEAQYYRVVKTFNDSSWYHKPESPIREAPESTPYPIWMIHTFEGLGDHFWNIDIDVEFYQKDPSDGGYILIKKINLERQLYCPVEWQNKSFIELLKEELGL